MWAVIAPALTLLSLTAVQAPGELCADFQPCTGHHLEAWCTWTMGGRVGWLARLCPRATYGEFAHLAESLVCRVYLRSWAWPRGQDEVESLPWESSQGSGVETSKRQRTESPSGAVGTFSCCEEWGRLGKDISVRWWVSERGPSGRRGDGNRVCRRREMGESVPNSGAPRGWIAAPKLLLIYRAQAGSSPP